MKISTFEHSNNTTLNDAALLDVTLDRQADTPLFEQLVQALRQIILAGRLRAGSKLPSTRKLAGELSVSRVTIITAYDQLTAEGYIESRHGSGAYVVEGLPDEVLQVNRPVVAVDHKTWRPQAIKPFHPTSPDMRLFPHKQWAKIFQQVWSNPHHSLLASGETLGWWPLRQQIAEHLRIWRGINCLPEQVVITSGAGEALTSLVNTLLQPSQYIAQEEPGYNHFSHILARSHVNLHRIPVDDQGLQVTALDRANPQPSMAITTPSRQFPLGITMPLTRRLQLLDWAGQGDRYIIEDDFDSEYRYIGQPLPALMSLAHRNNVIYLGSFTKVFSKSLRLGYVVVPERSLPAIEKTMAKNGIAAAGPLQPVLAQFMASGGYASHIRRMRRTYSTRQKVFVAAAQDQLSGLIEFENSGGGMHLVGSIGNKLAGQMSDVEICRRANEAGVMLMPLSKNYSNSKPRQGVIAGYAGFDEEELIDAIGRLVQAFTC